MDSRNSSLDLIRCFALFCVVSVHFFLNNGFYDVPVTGVKMFAMFIMRSFFIICVPLFLLLSGYLMRKNKLDRAFYLKGRKTLCIYLLASLLCICYKVFFQNSQETLLSHLLRILNFTAAPYGWYMELYFGLFLLMPFLNIIYSNMTSKKQELALVGTLLLLTSIFGVTNISVKILPSWWQNLYPVTYYFLGCYLGKNKPTMNRSLNICLILLSVLISGSISYYLSYGKAFTWGVWNDYSSILVVIPAVLVFVLFANVKIISEKFSHILMFLSKLCLGAYLLSWIFDKTFYPSLLERVPVMYDRIYYYFLYVPLVFVCALAMSFVLERIYGLLVCVARFAKCILSRMIC